MRPVFFYNEGLMDERAFKAFGVSAKLDDSAIGYFGTGLKYAIAILLRNDHRVKIFIDGKEFKFGKTRVNIRNKEFEMITCNGEELPYTTELGKDWKLWQAFRELYCNAIDEKGGCTDNPELDVTEPKKGKTVILVDGAGLHEIYKDRSEIILPDWLEEYRISRPNGEIDVYNKPSKYLYYRGVRVAEFRRPALYTYNMKMSVSLTEDRTLAYQWQAHQFLALGLMNIQKKEHAYTALVARDNVMEFEADFDFIKKFNKNEISSGFNEAIEQLFNDNDPSLNPAARVYHKERNDLEHGVVLQPIELNVVEKKQLERAIEIGKKIFRDFDRYEIVPISEINQVVHALADKKKNRIYLTTKCFQNGTKYLLSTLIEEYAHLKTGYGDQTRELQTWLFDQIVNVTETYVVKEPV